MTPRLRCRENQLEALAARYQYPVKDTELQSLAPRIAERGWMTMDELRKVARWKAPRSAGRMETNSEEYVKEITGFAFGATTERARIEILTTLDGVQWPTASVILHFFHREPYPITDFRTLWSVSLGVPKQDVPKQYRFRFWWTYVRFCRDLANRCGVDMRTLDRALWQYSKENQKDA